MEQFCTNIEEFLKSLKTASFNYLDGIEAKEYLKRKNNITVIKTAKKKVNSIKPKGDIELKNIQYRITDKRYIGRKQINGKILTVYAKTQKDCLEKLKEAIKEATSFNHKQEKAKNIFKELYMTWYKQEKEPFITEGTKNDILLAYKKLEHFHNVSINKLTKQEIINTLNKMEDNRSKEKTRLYLNAFLKYYQNEGILKVNPCANVKVKKSNNRKQAFTYEQQKLILENLKMPLKPIILIYLLTGLRKNEFNFKNIENDIDFDNKVLKAINLKGRNLVKRYKHIKLSNAAIKLIMDNLDIIHSYNSETVYKEFSNFLKELKVSGSIVTCRHTFATNCFYLNKPDLIISREMGHSRTQLTKDVYTDIDFHLTADKIRNLYHNFYNEI